MDSAVWRSSLEARPVEPNGVGEREARLGRDEQEAVPFRVLRWCDGQGDVWLLGLPTGEVMAGVRLRKRPVRTALMRAKLGGRGRVKFAD